MRDNFESVVSEDAILEAVSRIEEDGTFDWAPSSQHRNKIDAMEEALAEQFDDDDYGFDEIETIAAERAPANLGSEQELISRGELLEQIAALKDALPKPTAHGGMGHNQPPAEFELEVEQQVDVAESLEVIEAELTADQPNVEAVAKKSSVINRIMGWIGGKLDTSAEAFCKSFGSTLGKAAGVALPASILASPYWGKISCAAWRFERMVVACAGAPLARHPSIDKKCQDKIERSDIGRPTETWAGSNARSECLLWRAALQHRRLSLYVGSAPPRIAAPIAPGVVNEPRLSDGSHLTVRACASLPPTVVAESHPRSCS